MGRMPELVLHSISILEKYCGPRLCKMLQYQLLASILYEWRRFNRSRVSPHEAERLCVYT